MKNKVRVKGQNLSARRNDMTAPFHLLFTESLGLSSREDWLGEYRAVVERPTPDPQAFLGCPDDFRDHYWYAEAFSKHPWEVGIDRDEAAMASFREAETRCSNANSELVEFFSRARPDRLRTVLRSARSRLRWLLEGITPEEVVRRGGWGPGASLGLGRRLSSHQIKWEFATHMTKGCQPYVEALWRYARLPDRSMNRVCFNRVTTVPKNAKTNRTIAIEPEWNMYFQLGLGRAIRSRLQKRVGLLHPTAQSRNQSLARAGSANQWFSTLDLKGASDGISLAICELLLPPAVFQQVMALRSPYGVLPDGSVVEYEKVSSMGNGFTFELETAIFWAICSSVAGDAVVYGDDIIVPTESAEEVIEVLISCGFIVNDKKTFTKGPFRESCGGHYFEGADVTPPYFKKPLDSLPSIISAANRLSFLCDRGGYKDGRFHDAWSYLTTAVPRFLWGPRDAGDGVLAMPFDAVRPRKHSGFQCYQGKRLELHRRTQAAPLWGALMSFLSGDSHVATFPTHREVIRVGTWYLPKWSDDTPWLNL